MSKFQVGDKVVVTGDTRSYAHGLSQGTPAKVEHLSRSDEYGTLATVLVPSGAMRKVHADDLVLAGECVPDVDGNPIRVGQLVEFSYPWDRTYRNGDVWWVEAVHPQDGTITRRNCAIDPYPANKFAVVTDTFRPSEPDTRDVTLRVTVGATPYVLDRGVAEAVRDALRQDGRFDGADWDGFTVEVVDDGGHDDD